MVWAVAEKELDASRAERRNEGARRAACPPDRPLNAGWLGRSATILTSVLPVCNWQRPIRTNRRIMLRDRPQASPAGYKPAARCGRSANQPTLLRPLFHW